MRNAFPPSPSAAAHRRWLAALVLPAGALLPVTASANVGTPLLWAATFHLILGNAILGVIEGLLLHSFLKAPVGRSILCMVLANYVSGFVGGSLLDDQRLISLLFPHVSIVNLRSFFWLVALGAFVLTLTLEFPFIWASLRGTRSAFWHAVGADLAIHAVTYPLIFFVFWSFSGTTLLTRVSVVDASSLVPTEVYDLYYLTPDGKRVMKTRLGSTRHETVREVTAPGSNDRLFARRDSQGKLELRLHLDRDPNAGPQPDEIILRDFASQASLDFNIEQRYTDKPNGTWQNNGPASMLATTSDWRYTTGFWPVEGIRGGNLKDGSKFQFSLETIFFQWAARNATHLQGDTVVFQLGKDQICLMHPPTRRITLLVRGKGPVVAKPKP